MSENMNFSSFRNLQTSLENGNIFYFTDTSSFQTVLAYFFETVPDKLFSEDIVFGSPYLFFVARFCNSISKWY